MLNEFKPGLFLQNITPLLSLSKFRLIALDMDSTLINIECIDQIAAWAGRGQEVALITEAAMSGQLVDFKESLRRRVALLKGVPESALLDIYQNQLQLNPGARNLVQRCHQAGMKSLLVSGGFTFFTDRIQESLGLHFSRSNQLEINQGRLTGQLVMQEWGDICDGEMKQTMLLQTCAQLGIEPKSAIAMGDGANDLPMMRVAGLSVAYRAKPLVRQNAHIAIDKGGLDRLFEVFSESPV